MTIDYDPNEDICVSDILDKGDVMELAAAIRRGDMHAADAALDIAFRDDPEVSEWIAQARVSTAGRAA